MQPRAITGFGICCALGVGREAFFAAMREPHPLSMREPRPVQAWDASARAGALVAEVPDFDASRWLGSKGLRTLDRLTRLMLVAARLATHDAGLKKDGAFVACSPARVGVCCSSAYAGLEAMVELSRVALLEDARYINPAKFPNTVANTPGATVSIWEDLRALNVALSNGNSGALDAFAMADLHLGAGRADAVLAGGGEASSEALFMAFERVGALAAGAILGEGAAFFVLEPEQLALRRGAKLLALVAGTGTAFEPAGTGTHVLSASAEAVARAVRGALRDAGIDAEEIDLVVSGVSGLPAFDRAELAGIARAVRKDVAVVAPKAFLGETLGASGAMAAATALACLDTQTGAPVRVGQETVPLALVAGEARAPIRAVLLTALGYYGNASAVVLRAPRGQRER